MPVVRARSVSEVLTRQAGRWRKLRDQIRTLHGDVLGAAGDAELEDRSSESLAKLGAAVDRFESAAHSPDVTVATTGTTSSGKSTLANLLIGEELLPKAVQEMSAGVVRVHHDGDTRTLEVEDTRGASWPVGRWNDVDAEQVRHRLEDTMAAYRRMLGDGGTVESDLVEPPRFIIRWPTALGARAEDFGLPAGTNLTIVDLPGLKYVNDDVNGPVVRAQVKKALCIVAYNSFETDPRKQAALLREVVDQVKALRGSPARMLFVLNRIDAFLKDRDPGASEREFADRVTRQIRSGLREALPEFTHHVETITPLALSSEPALYCSLARSRDPEEAVALIRRLKREYAGLFPEEELESLPGSPPQWSDTQREWFLAEARRTSRFDRFEDGLRQHISKNLPELLLPDLVEAADEAARESLAVVEAIILAYGESEREKVAEAKDRLEEVYKSLKRLKTEAVKILDPLREVADGDGDLMERLFVAVPEVERRLGVPHQSGRPSGPLAALLTALPDAVQEPLQRLNDIVMRLMAAEDVEDTLLDGLVSAPELHAAVEKLRAGPYGQLWQSGGVFEADDANDVEASISSLARALAATAQELVAREAVVQADRMKTALDACGSIIVAGLEAKAASQAREFQGLRGVFRGGFDLAPPRLPPLQFSPDVERWSRMESNLVDQPYKEKQHWFWRLLGYGKWVQKTRKVVVRTEHEGVKVSKLGDLLEGFASSGSRTTLEAVFAGWLVDGVATFDRALEGRVERGVRTYRTVLQKRMSEIEQGAAARISAVEAHRASVRGLADDLGRAVDWRRDPDE